MSSIRFNKFCLLEKGPKGLAIAVDYERVYKEIRGSRGKY
jgi:hypothetical protein